MSLVELVDTHCHLDFDRFDEDRDAVLANAAGQGVTRVINPGLDLENSRKVVEQAQRYQGVFAAVGFHPNSTAHFKPDHLAEIRELARQPKVIAIGEIGLDYYWDKSPKDAQIAAFEAQLTLAAELALPVIIHNREASEDVTAILETWVKTLPESLRSRPGVMHSFSANMAIAERILAIGFYLGFTGPITYKNAEETRRIAAQVPIDRLLVETDAPFLTPIPHRGERNQPIYIPLIVDRLASVKQVSFEEMGQATTQNADRLFRLSV
ncbi:MAG: TatD family hydrolase [Anaerolineae bacterium]|nr:TatD family hydrolase [Anaerolineae bacterium]